MSLPPVAQRINGKLMRVARSANLDIANVLGEVIQSVRNGFTRCQRGPIVVVDFYRRLGVAVPWSVQRTD